MVKFDTEQAIPFPKASKSIIGHPSLATLHRWRTRGVRGHRLETFLLGGRRYVTRAAIAKFIAACTSGADGEPTAQRTSRQRSKQRSAADKILKKAGI